jgi:hypothetical protein
MRDIRISGLRIEAADGTKLTFDVSYSEGHQLPSNVTQYPVEGDLPMADGVQLLPRTFTAEVMTSTAPNTAGFEQPSPNRDIEMGQRLVRLRNSKQLLKLTTEDGVLENFVLRSVTWTRTGETGEAIYPSLEFVEVMIATRQMLSIPPIVRPRRGRGQQDGALYSEVTLTSRPTDTLSTEYERIQSDWTSPEAIAYGREQAAQMQRLRMPAASFFVPIGTVQFPPF